MNNEQCTLGAGSAVILAQAVGLQGLVAMGPHGQYRTPEVCGQPYPSHPANLRGISLGGTKGRYVGAGTCIAGAKIQIIN